MASIADRRRSSAFFNRIAERYDAHRPGYPESLIDRACEAAGLEPGDRVLEVGCGTGQLTRSLLARGLVVTAVEPGTQLIAQAQAQLSNADEVTFVNARFEDARLPQAGFRAVFSASAWHWIDPDVGWGKAADALADHGTLALLSYFGLDEPTTAGDQRALRDAISRIAPEVAVGWPSYRGLDPTLTGVAARRGNISEVWAWMGSYELARRGAAELFGQAEIAAMPAVQEHTGKQLSAVLSTMSFWAGLSAQQREAILAENEALEQRLGRPIRSSILACLVAARRNARR